MVFVDRKTVHKLREQYPAGTRVILTKMEDDQAPPIGTMGTVERVDDSGSLCVRWDNGSGLHVVYGEDEVLIAA